VTSMCTGNFNELNFCDATKSSSFIFTERLKLLDSLLHLVAILCSRVA